MRPRTLLFCLIFSALVFSAAANPLLQDVWTMGNLTNDDVESARKKKRGGNRYMMPLLFGSLLVKAVLFPLAFKAMAVMSGVSVLLSTLSLIVTSIVAFAKLALKSNPVKVVHKFPYNSWAKDDNLNNFYGTVDGYAMVPPSPQ